LNEQILAIVVAAGRGERAGLVPPKQYRPIAGRPLLARCLGALAAHPAIAGILTVIAPEDRPHFDAVMALLPGHVRDLMLEPVAGGASRQASVMAGLDALDRLSPPALVLIHDAARPFPSVELIGRVIDGARGHGAAIPGIAVTDTIKLIDDASMVQGTPVRAMLRAVQTPQGFAFAPLMAAHRKAALAGGLSFTDDAALIEWSGGHVQVVAGDPANFKVTMPEDFERAERHVSGPCPEIRVGSGYDVHAFTDGDHVWLGGVRVAHDRGVLAHSDGDVVLHALTDAILGALADGDIGTHFPPSDMRWRGQASALFLEHAAGLVAARGGRILHLDATVICEAPRIGAHREAMRAEIARAAGIAIERVSIKATTSERLGFTGRREGLAAQATATLSLPLSLPVDD
jgi:2-C-methyl-D-erythritol 4-phosphate cytidylyltransferase/2-C-methyl-D-erythritol 2,4-cyclodiphosphate synthase